MHVIHVKEDLRYLSIKK